MKFNPKIYAGKSRVYVAVPNAPRISRLWTWNDEKKCYETPMFGKCYTAGRYESDSRGTRRRKYQFFESLDEARRWQTESEKDSEPKRVEEAPEKSGPTFNEIVEEWKKRCFPGLAPSTRVRYQNLIDLYLGTFMNLTIYEITPKCIDGWLDLLKDPNHWTMKSRKRLMFDHELSLLSTILKYYANYHDDSHFQFPIKQRHKDAVWLKRQTKVSPKNLPEEEFLRFREQLALLPQGSVLACLATVQYYQALRISEAAAIYREDVLIDWKVPENSRLRIQRAVVWLRKKGLDSYISAGFKNSESNDGIKEQPMFPETFEAFLKVQADGKPGLVFEYEGTHFPYRILQKRYDKAFKMAGLPYRGTHIMRHGGCSRLFDEKGDLGIAKQILGNSSLRSVSVYAHRSASALTDVAKRHWREKEKTSGDCLQVPANPTAKPKLTVISST